MNTTSSLALVVLLSICAVFAYLWQDAKADRDSALQKIGIQAACIESQRLSIERLHNATKRNDVILSDWGAGLNALPAIAVETAVRIQEAKSETLDLDAPLPGPLLEPLRLRWQTATGNTHASNPGNATLGSAAGAPHPRAAR